MNNHFFSGMSPDHFLKNYWNKAPFLFKEAVPNTFDLGDFNDFFEMSLDSDFETRMVYEDGGDYPWQAKKGPFTKKDFKKKALWTLICHNLELFNEDLYAIKEKVNFISDWHFDDVMATISKKGASVGAHIDDYSVFIFQGRGRRKWLLETNPNPEFVPDIDIKLLKEFNPNIEWTLNPGDMIYIPPNVAHHGISLEDSISYSIGFKSIRFQALLETMITTECLNFDQYSFHDRKNKKSDDPFMITDSVINDLQRDLIKIIADKDLLKKTLGLHLSNPKNEIFPIDELDAETVKKLLKTRKIKRDIWAKLVATKKDGKMINLTINKRAYLLSNQDYQEIKKIFEVGPHESIKMGKNILQNRDLLDFLISIILEGVFYFD
ncbi:MAG: cupin domain-containing protein [Bacteriovorax sp.]